MRHSGETQASSRTSYRESGPGLISATVHGAGSPGGLGSPLTVIHTAAWPASPGSPAATARLRPPGKSAAPETAAANAAAASHPPRHLFPADTFATLLAACETRDHPPPPIIPFPGS